MTTWVFYSGSKWLTSSAHFQFLLDITAALGYLHPSGDNKDQDVAETFLKSLKKGPFTQAKSCTTCSRPKTVYR